MAPQLNLDECYDHLVAAWDCQGYVNIVSPVDNFRGRFFNTASETFLEDTLTYIEQLDRQQPKGIYMRVTSTTEVPETGRGGAGISASLPCLWLDMDIAGPGHKPSQQNPLPLPAAEINCRQIIEHAKVPEPTLWIHSGGGLYPFWYLKTPLDITDPAAFDRWETLSEALHLAVNRAAADLGWRYDTGTHDLARVLRIPGTVNRKVKEEPTQARYFHREIGGPTYTPEDLEAGILLALEAWPDLTPVRQAPPRPARTTMAGELLPGTDYNQRVDFLRDLLEPAGWQYHSSKDEEVFVTRPGKAVREGLSATLNYKGSGNLFILTSEPTGLPMGQGISPFHYYALTRHNGDHRAATKDLAAQGYGTPLTHRPQVVDGFGGTTALTVPPISSNGHREHVSAVNVDHDGEVIPPQEPVHSPPPVAGHIRKYGFSDLDNARRVADRVGQRRLLLLEAQDCWAIYHDGQWKLDKKKSHRTMAIITETLQEAFDEEWLLHSDMPAFGSGNRPVKTEREKFNAHVSASFNENRLSACRKLLATRPGMLVSLSDFDTDPTKVNVRNGYLDLVTGELVPHDPKHLCRTKINVDYNPAARSELWEKCLEQWHPDEELRHVLHKIMGYTLSTDVSVQGFFIHSGTGSNGKSVFFDVLQNLMADYAQVVPRQALMARKHDSTASPEILRMAGKRLLYCSELKVGEVIDSAAVKGLTGGDVQVARDLYSGFEEFTPTGKLHFSTNHAPGIPDDDASWRRVWVFKWGTKITEAEADATLAYKLKRNEAEGILAWLVRGYQAYVAEGVERPESMCTEVAEYREREDLLGDFVDSCLEQVEPTSEGEEVWAATQQLFDAYQHWCDRSGVQHRMHKLTFGKAMTERGFVPKPKSKARGFINVKVTSVSDSTWIVSRTPTGFRY